MSHFVRAKFSSVLDAAVLRARAALWRLTGKFDTLWYRDFYPALPTDVDAVLHYIAHGASAGLVRPPDLKTARRIRRKERAGAFNRGWYGARALAESERFRSADTDGADRALYDQRLAILRLYHPPAADTTLQRIAPAQEVRALLASQSPACDTKKLTAARLTLATHSLRGGSIESCAKSVADLVRTAGAENIEWLIVNDDPGQSSDALLRALPSAAAACVRLVPWAPNISSALGLARQHGRFEWLMALSLKDEIDREAAAIIGHYARQFPLCRCIIGGVADRELNSDFVFYNPLEHDGAGLFAADADMLAPALRRDVLEQQSYPALFVEQGGYGSAMQIASGEPVLLTPEYLYCRRKGSQVGRSPDAARRFLISRLGQDITVQPRRPPPSSGPRRGICFTRTQGNRPDLLEQAVRSVAEQEDLQACVIVHASEIIKTAVADRLAERGLNPLILHAPDLTRKRGAPLNVGVDYLCAHSDEFDFFCFLDDDDLLYPFFAEVLREALRLSGADIAAALACAHVEDAQPVVEHPLMPTFGLTKGNIFPINAYVIRTGALLASGARFREDLHYLEDWDFLLQLYGAGARVQHLPQVLSGYRIIGDGNRVAKENEAEFQRCWDEAAPRGEDAARRFGRAVMWQDLAEFDFDNVVPLSDSMLLHMRKAVQIFAPGADPWE